VYLIVALIATTLGALTGMGGGVMLRPALDLLGGLDALNVSMMSSIAVLSMTTISIGRQIHQKAAIDYKLSGALALGSLFGGNAGQFILTHAIAHAENSTVVAVQNAVLALMILGVLIYMHNKSKVNSPGLKKPVPAVLTGVCLGILASFLGIGGGPINVAVIIYLFGLNTKSAALCSLVTIFFSQAANVLSVALFKGFSNYDFSLLPYLVIGAVTGGFIGATLSKKLHEKTVDRTFKGISLFVMAICVVNILRILMFLCLR